MSRQAWMELFSWTTADGTAIANSVTETIVFGSGILVPATYLQDSRVMHYVAYGRLSTTSSPTVRFRFRHGGVSGTVIWDSGTITCGATVTASLWMVEIDITTRSNGASGTVFAVGPVNIGSALAPTVGSATGAAAVGVFGSAGDDTPAAVTVDLTADNAWALTALWGTQSASNTLTGHNQYLYTTN